MHFQLVTKKTLSTLFLPLFFYCTSTVSYKEIPADFVYTIKQHRDSIYYTTNSGEIYRFHPESSFRQIRIGLKKNHPFRSLLFVNDSLLFACSYRSGLYRVCNDSLSTLSGWHHPAWSMKSELGGTIWLAGKTGVYKQYGDSFVPFSNIKESFDLAFYNNRLVVAHHSGISFYDLNSGKLTRTICRDTACWMTTAINDSQLVCGGVECCVIINKGNIRTVRLGPKNNIPWACVIDSSNSVILATEKGLYQIIEGDTKTRCIGYKNKCIKSVLIDSKGKLMVGRYFRNTH